MRLPIILVSLCATLALFVNEPALPQGLSTNGDACSGLTFYHARLGKDDYTNFERAILRIQAGHETATGYLVDTKQGYVITAFHVVEAAYENPSIEITATNPEIPSLKSPLKLSIVAEVADPGDVALLKIADTSTLITDGVQALEIGLDFLPSSQYVTMGYPKGTNLQEQPAAWEGPSRDSPGYYDVGQDVEQGDSGSPIIDDQGVVVGTLVAKPFANRALYTRLVDVQPLFDKLPADSRMQSMEQDALDSNLSTSERQSEMINDLKWVTGNPSNLELLEWANLMARRGAKFKPEQALLGCPILRAYEDRRLAEANPALLLSAFASPAAHAHFLLSAATQDLNLGRPVLAREKSQQAALIFQTMQDKNGEAWAFTSEGIANLDLHEFNDASKTLSQAAELPAAPGDKARLDVYLAQAYAGYGDNAAASQYINDALPKLKEYTDFDGQALAYNTLGKLDEAQGNYDVAINHLTQSRDLFRQSGNTVHEFEVRADLKQAYEVESAKSSQNFLARHWVFAIIIGLLIVLVEWFAARNLEKRRAK